MNQYTTITRARAGTFNRTAFVAGVLMCVVTSSACSNQTGGAPFGPQGVARSGSSGGGSGRWTGTASCMRITGGDGDMTRTAIATSLNVASITTTEIVLTGVRIGPFSDIECSDQTLTGVANGRGTSAADGFTVNKFEADCSDSEGNSYTATADGFLIGNQFHMTLFLVSGINAAQCFFALKR